MPKGRKPLYPWQDWFDALDRVGYIRLEAGQDFEIPIATMRKSILTECRKRDLRVRSMIQQDRRWLRVELARRHRGYPWDEWLGGQMQRLVPGRDFDCHHDVMREQARRAAKQRGIGFRSRWMDGQLWIQGLTPKATEPCPNPEPCADHPRIVLHDSNALESTRVRSAVSP